MKKFLRPLLLFGLIGTGTLAARAQGVGIGTTTPDAKAALEIKASDKGLLIPRLSAAQRAALTSVPQGLLVYQTDGTATGGPQTGFWYYGGSGGWVFLDANAGAGLTLPYRGTASSSAALLDVTNTGTGAALSGSTASGLVGAPAVLGNNTGTGGAATGVLGQTSGGYGVRGTASGAGGYGVSGEATDSRGVSGRSQSGPGLYGSSTSGVAVQGVKGTGQTGRAAEFTSTDAANDSTLVHLATAGDRPALRALNSSASAQAALRGVKTAGTAGAGVEGVVTSGGGNAAGVLGQDKTGNSIGSGVLGQTAGGYGVRGIASASGGYGVSGTATDSYGVIGTSTSGVGTAGSSSSGIGVQGSSGSSSGVYGSTSSAATSGVAGVHGVGSSAIGVLGQSASGNAVRGEASGSGVGIVGVGSGSGRAGFFQQANPASTAPAVEITQAGSGPALKLTGTVNTPLTGGASLLPAAYGCVSWDGTRVSGTPNWTVTQLSQGYYRITFTSPDLANQFLLDRTIQVTPYSFYWPGQPILWGASVVRFPYPYEGPVSTPNGSVDVVVCHTRGGNIITQGTDNPAGLPTHFYQLFNFSFTLY